ncbi:regulatory protein RecX [Aquimarina rhabdastrellae]
MYYKPQQSKKPTTVKEALLKMEHYCAYQDRCHQDVNTKLQAMQLIPEAQEKIILHLIEHNFLNETRFAKSFARGKFNIKKWGKQRILSALKSKGISQYNIKIAMAEIDPEAYLTTFNTLAEKKFATLGDLPHQKKRQKMLYYLSYRGWESHLIYDKIQELLS